MSNTGIATGNTITVIIIWSTPEASMRVMVRVTVTTTIDP